MIMMNRVICTWISFFAMEFFPGHPVFYAQTRVAVLPFKNVSSVYGIEQRVYQRVIANLVNRAAGSLEVMDRNSLMNIFSEQKIGMSGLVDESTVLQYGKILGIQFIIEGNVLNGNYVEEPDHREPVIAWERYETNDNGMRTIRGKRVQYYIVERKNRVHCEMSCQMINVETTKIAGSNIIEADQDDFIQYAEYDGDYQSLLKNDPNPQFENSKTTNLGLRTAEQYVDTFHQLGAMFDKVDDYLFTRRNSLEPRERLAEQVIDQLAERFSSFVINSLNGPTQ
jgi:hypothetical protein